MFHVTSPILVTTFTHFGDIFHKLLCTYLKVDILRHEINGWEFAGNNLGFAGRLLYNRELTKETKVGLLLKRLKPLC